LHPGHLSRLMLTKRRQYPEMMAYQHPRSLRPQKKAGPLRPRSHTELKGRIRCS
jgi:hypothetical protein